MLSRKTAHLPYRRNTTALFQSSRRTMLEPLTAWFAAHWATVCVYQWVTTLPVLLAEVHKPGLVTHKVPLLHHLYERKNEMKMLRHLDHIVTDWMENVDASTYDDVISRVQNPL